MYTHPETRRRVPGPTTFTTKADAGRWLATAEADLHRGDDLDPAGRSVRFCEFADKWLAGKTSIRPKTRELHEYLLRAHIKPGFEDQPLTRVSSATVREWNSNLRSGAVSETTAAKAYRLLRQIMQTAVEDQLIRENPCRIKGASTERSKERDIPTLAEVERLADAIEPRYRAMVLLGAFAGARTVAARPELRPEDRSHHLVLRTVCDRPTLWEALLPVEALVMPVELAAVDRLLDDPRFFEPFRKHFDPTWGRPSIPIETYLRLMFLKYRYRLGYATLCVEVADSLSWLRFARIPIAEAAPHPSTLMKITTRCGPELIEELNAELVVTAVKAGVVEMEWLRADTTVVPADIKYPTDSGLLVKGVTKAAGLVERIQGVGVAPRTCFDDRTVEDAASVTRRSAT